MRAPLRSSRVVFGRQAEACVSEGCTPDPSLVCQDQMTKRTKASPFCSPPCYLFPDDVFPCRCLVPVIVRLLLGEAMNEDKSGACCSIFIPAGLDGTLRGRWANHKWVMMEELRHRLQAVVRPNRGKMCNTSK